MEKPIVGAAAFIKKSGKILLTYDPKFEFWRVPGGKIEYGERVEDTLKREMKEELSVDIFVDRFLGFGQDEVVIWKEEKICRVILYFECHIVSGEIKKSDEVTDFNWLTIEEIKKYNNLEPAMMDYYKTHTH